MGVPTALRRLARLYGIQTAYYSNDQQLCVAGETGLVRTLQALGVPIESADDAPRLVQLRRRELWSRMVEPVVVAWNGQANIPLRLLAASNAGPLSCEIDLEEGGRQTWTGDIADLPLVSRRMVDGDEYHIRRLVLPFPLPMGYHRLTLNIAGGRVGTLLISAPEKSYQRAIPDGEKAWGVFVPLYALHSQASWGGGDFSDLERLIRLVSSLGGRLVATLPLLSWLAEVSDDPSPYSAGSRLFWNDFYIDVTRVPEYRDSAEAQALVQSERFQQELEQLRQLPTVDYDRQMALKREVMLLLSRTLTPVRKRELEQFRTEHPEIELYAKFRAVCEKQGRTWVHWPERLRNGDLRAEDYDETIFRYHLYTQWQVDRQLQHLAAETGERQMLWYLDYPLGVSGEGFDAWRMRDLFVRDASGGAPPDGFFTLGQNWGFPPLHPERLREQGYRYLIQSLRRHLRYARLLRIDHVMGLHRFYWIPAGLGARDGVYVRYRTDELFALLSVESHRHQAQIIGENLGTVPEAVVNAMERHGIQGMFVVQFECRPHEIPSVRSAPRNVVASLNTHDMPTFASFWNALDVEDRLDLGLLGEEEAQHDRDARAFLRQATSDFLRSEGLLGENNETPAALRGFLSWLARGEAEVVLVTLEDLWEEPQPQNTPGTFQERPNWRRKTRFSLEEIEQHEQLREILRAVDQYRRCRDA